jgi:glyoxylase-like metal-dependent hydrolase (beta-lactamase superfamily II)
MEIQCIRADNPGLMTGAGTNTYLIGTDKYLLIDPGPSIEAHIKKLINLRVSLCGILLTHFHKDHAENAMTLKNKLSIPIYAAMPSTYDPINNIAIDYMLEDNSVINFGADQLIAIHTPGHASNHFCFFSPSINALFSGDHVMNGSTVVINPPDGDMNAYINSLNKIKIMRLETIFPGHGAPIKDPTEEIQFLINHRRKRELRVLATLNNELQSIDELVVNVYQDKDALLFPIAKKTLEAHLIKLKTEGLATSINKHWCLRS